MELKFEVKFTEREIKEFGLGEPKPNKEEKIGKWGHLSLTEEEKNTAKMDASFNEDFVIDVINKVRQIYVAVKGVIDLIVPSLKDISDKWFISNAAPTVEEAKALYKLWYAYENNGKNRDARSAFIKAKQCFYKLSEEDKCKVSKLMGISEHGFAMYIYNE